MRRGVVAVCAIQMQLECGCGWFLKGELTRDIARLLWQQKQRAGRALNTPISTQTAEKEIIIQRHTCQRVRVRDWKRYVELTFVVTQVDELCVTRCYCYITVCSPKCHVGDICTFVWWRNQRIFICGGCNQRGRQEIFGARQHTCIRIS